VHYDDLPHGFIQMTRHSKRCLESTLEIARLLGEALKKTRAARPSAESALRSPRLVESSLGNCRKRTAVEVCQAGMTSLSHAAMGNAWQPLIGA